MQRDTRYRDRFMNVKERERSLGEMPVAEWIPLRYRKGQPAGTVTNALKGHEAYRGGMASLVDVTKKEQSASERQQGEIVNY